MNNDRSASDDRIHVLEVSGNCSLSKKQAAAFFAGIAAASLAVALFFTAQGFWPILPFAGAELFLLGLALGMNMRRGAYREVITVSDVAVVVERGLPESRERIEFPRHWARVELARSPRRWHPSALRLCASKHHCEVGASLTEDERQSLSRRLGELIGGSGQSPVLTGRPGA